MAWKCPACSTPIRQQLTAAGEEAPRPGVMYCCSVCRSELILDPHAQQMTTAPLPADTADDKHPKERHATQENP